MKCRFRLRKPLVLSVELRGPLNRERIDGLDDNEQVAKDDPQIIDLDGRERC
jgi:hypothetical protein